MEVCRKPRQVLRLRSANLGFQPEDIRLLLVTHARVDHAGATAHFKKLSGAKVAGMDRDFERLFDLRLNWDARWRLREISYRLCFSSPTRVSAFASDCNASTRSRAFSMPASAAS